MKKLMSIIVCSLLVLNFCGCVAIIFGTAGGAGTAVWLSGKLVAQVQAPYDRTIEAAKDALKSMNLEIAKEVKGNELTQIRSYYTDGQKIWIDIRQLGENSSSIEVRVGFFGDRNASSILLNKITSHL